MPFALLPLRTKKVCSLVGFIMAEARPSTSQGGGDNPFYQPPDLVGKIGPKFPPGDDRKENVSELHVALQIKMATKEISTQHCKSTSTSTFCE